MQHHGCEGTSPDREAWPPSEWPDPARLERAIGKLKPLHDGDQGFVDVIACGRQAIPALRALLFERGPSGLFQTRCRAVEALAALGASGRVEAIPYLVEALAEDENRLAAEAALRNYGSLAHQALAVAACQSWPLRERVPLAAAPKRARALGRNRRSAGLMADIAQFNAAQRSENRSACVQNLFHVRARVGKARCGLALDRPVAGCGVCAGARHRALPRALFRQRRRIDVSCDPVGSLRPAGPLIRDLFF
jgi:hypothetical protein